jgi:cell wall-associated NlpC family hydrolase
MPDPISTAKSFLGTPYVWGGASLSGVDCSGFVQQVYPSLPRVAHLQYNATQRFSDPAQLQSGDLVFLHGTQHNPPVPADWASHVGIYDGAGMSSMPAAPKAG